MFHRKEVLLNRGLFSLRKNKSKNNLQFISFRVINTTRQTKEVFAMKGFEPIETIYTSFSMLNFLSIFRQEDFK